MTFVVWGGQWETTTTADYIVSEPRGEKRVQYNIVANIRHVGKTRGMDTTERIRGRRGDDK